MLQSKDNSLAKHVKQNGKGTIDRKIAAQERLDRLSERLAKEGYHEAAELMLDERHLALQRCLNSFKKVK